MHSSVLIYILEGGLFVDRHSPLSVQSSPLVFCPTNPAALRHSTLGKCWASPGFPLPVSLETPGHKQSWGSANLFLLFHRSSPSSSLKLLFFIYFAWFWVVSRSKVNPLPVTSSLLETEIYGLYIDPWTMRGSAVPALHAVGPTYPQFRISRFSQSQIV